MTIETKYNVWDKGWVMNDNRPLEIMISGINISVDMDTDRNPAWSYCPIYRTNAGKTYREKEIFRSKEELIKSL